MTRRSRPTFTPEFKLESAQLVVNQGYSVKEAASAMNVSQVHGFIKRSNGVIKVDSEIGKGTTISLYFPRHIGKKKSGGAVVNSISQ